jgi:hypothetical protein
VLALELHTVKPQERENLEAMAIVVSSAEQLGIGYRG